MDVFFCVMPLAQTWLVRHYCIQFKLRNNIVIIRYSGNFAPGRASQSSDEWAARRELAETFQIGVQRLTRTSQGVAGGTPC